MINPSLPSFLRLALATIALTATSPLLAQPVLTQPALAQPAPDQSALAPDQDQAHPRLELSTQTDPSTGTISRGTYRVFENRATNTGREIHLNITILHATAEQPATDPVFYLLGGPGGAAAPGWKGFADSWMRADRDIVLVSQRGTDGDNRLDLLPAQSKDPETYLLSSFADPDRWRRTLEHLKTKYDLTQYSTCNAADDLNDIRQALDYDKINLVGGSYGTRMALIYLRRHPTTVRTATLSGIAPISFTNPLFHASSAQYGIEQIIKDCKTDPRYRDTYANLAEEFETVLTRLETKPQQVTITNPRGTHPNEIQAKVSRAVFAEHIRVLMYFSGTHRMVPLVIHSAYEGDFEPYFDLAIKRNAGSINWLAMGMLLCVTAAEDVARIDPDIVEPETRDTFLGDARVRAQMAIADFWPKSDLPANFADPVSVDVPTLLFSGSYDPVTPPRFGEDAARHLPNSLHLVVSATHDVGGQCVEDIKAAFLEQASVKDLDTSCIESIRMRAYELPNAN